MADSISTTVDSVQQAPEAGLLLPEEVCQSVLHLVYKCVTLEILIWASIYHPIQIWTTAKTCSVVRRDHSCHIFWQVVLLLYQFAVLSSKFACTLGSLHLLMVPNATTGTVSLTVL